MGSNSQHSPTYRVLYAIHWSASVWPYANFVRLVGSSGLEPPTSRLSGARSNHLSYEPIQFPRCISFPSLTLFCFPSVFVSFSLIPQRVAYIRFKLTPTVATLSGGPDWWRWWESNPWPPACRAGALPAELHPHWGLVNSEEWIVKSFVEKLRFSSSILHYSFFIFHYSFLLSSLSVTQNWTTMKDCSSHCCACTFSRRLFWFWSITNTSSQQLRCYFSCSP